MLQLEHITNGSGFCKFALFSKIILQNLKNRLFVVDKILTEALG